MLLFFGALVGGAARRGRKPIGEGVLLVDLDGIAGRAAGAAVGAEPGRRGSVAREHRLRDVVAAVDAAANGRPRQGDRARPRTLRRRRAERDRDAGRGARPRAPAGKPVLAYATGYSDDSYQLAAHASEIWMNPLGAVALAGPGGNNLYFKGLFDKLGDDRQRLSRRHLQGRDRALHAQRHVARGARRMPRRWPARCSRRGATTSAARAPPRRHRSTPICAIRWRSIRAAGGDFARAALAGQADRPARPSATPSTRGWPSLAASVDDQRDPLSPRSGLRDYVRDLDPDSARGPIGVVTVAGDDRRRQGRARQRRRRQHRRADRRGRARAAS